MNQSSEAGEYEPLHPERLTWAALLGAWVEFARRAVGLPDDKAGRRMKASVPDIIMLQAVWCALGEMEGLPADEQALGLDRAGLLIERHADALADKWAGEPMPEELAKLISDAWARLAERERATRGD